jgi:hypothetical protein
MSYREVQTMFDAAFPAGRQSYWTSDYLGEVGDGAIETVVARFAAVPSPHSAVLIEHLGGAVGWVGAEETAFAAGDTRTASPSFRCSESYANRLHSLPQLSRSQSITRRHELIYSR